MESLELYIREKIFLPNRIIYQAFQSESLVRVFPKWYQNYISNQHNFTNDIKKFDKIHKMLSAKAEHRRESFYIKNPVSEKVFIFHVDFLQFKNPVTSGDQVKFKLMLDPNDHVALWLPEKFYHVCWAKYREAAENWGKIDLDVLKTKSRVKKII